MSKPTTAVSSAGVFAVAVLVASVTAIPVLHAQTDRLGTPRPFDVDLTGDAGPGRIESGRSCASGGDGAYWHYDYESPLPAGVITGPANPLPGAARLHLDLHSEDHDIRATGGEVDDDEGGDERIEPGSAWLQGTDSTVTLSNQRGTVTMRVRSVTNEDGAGCTDPRLLDFDGIAASGNGLPWEITAATGSYRGAVGAGVADLVADVAPGADNPFTVGVRGDIAVLQPTLELEVVDTYWAFLGAHYLVRWVTVIYRVTNNGPGDAFGVRLVDATSPTAGMKLVGPIPFDTATTNLGPVPQFLADIPAGRSEIVRLRWELPFPAGDPPCETVILGCEFESTLTFELPDALDEVEEPQSSTVLARAPDFPPPVVD